MITRDLNGDDWINKIQRLLGCQRWHREKNTPSEPLLGAEKSETCHFLANT